MTSYVQLSKHRRQFLSMTGYTVEEFQALLPPFSAQFQQHVQHQTLVGKKRNKRRYSTYQNSPLPTFEDKLLFIFLLKKHPFGKFLFFQQDILIYLRKAATQELFGELFGMQQPLFGMQQPVANKWLHFLHPVLNVLSVLQNFFCCFDRTFRMVVKTTRHFRIVCQSSIVAFARTFGISAKATKQQQNSNKTLSEWFVETTRQSTRHFEHPHAY